MPDHDPPIPDLSFPRPHAPGPGRSPIGDPVTAGPVDVPVVERGSPTPGALPFVQRVIASPALRSGYTSAVVHVLLLTLLAVLWTDPPDRRRLRPLELAFSAATAAPPAADPAGDGGGGRASAATPDEPQAADGHVEVVPDKVVAVEVEPVDAASGDAPPAAIAAADARTAVAIAPGGRPERSGPGSTGDPVSPYATRRGEARADAVRTRGGTAASEAAVERGLAWLALHQAVDGSWRFDLSNCRCDGGCGQPGTVGSTTAATGLALLPFLGAGNTQAAGPYQETVARGLYHLLGRMRPTPRGGDLCEGTMYGQGAATLALAEAYAMTGDDLLARPLAEAVRFIVAAQDAHGGGWRYLPGQSGDTTVTAWQLAALKSAALGGIEVPSPTIDGVRRFLDRVQARDGQAYGYLGGQPQPCTSAIGLFCRLHTAWEQRDRLDHGLSALARPGPAPQEVYLNFYLSQALLQADHASWPRWNARNRDQLVAGQSAFGHEQGSWSFADRETAPGGRLAHTALAILTLEVYYRLLPLYRPEAVDHTF